MYIIYLYYSCKLLGKSNITEVTNHKKKKESDNSDILIKIFSSKIKFTLSKKFSAI